MKITKSPTSGIVRTAACVFAALSLGATSASAAYAKVTVDLSGKEFGQRVVTDPITLIDSVVPVNLHKLGNHKLKAATSYSYTITGTVHGNGVLASYVPAGTTISSYISHATLVNTYNNPGGTLPIVVVNKNVNTTQDIGFLTISVSMRVRGGVKADGTVYLDVKNFVTNPAYAIDATLQFDPGAKMVITALP